VFTRTMTAAKLKAHKSSKTSHTPESVSAIRLAIFLITAFIFGLAVCSAFFLWQIHNNDPVWATPHYHRSAPLSPHLLTGQLSQLSADGSLPGNNSVTTNHIPSSSILDGLRVLVTIASFDFMQLSHLEEVLDGFQDLCYAGSKVDIVVHTTVLVSAIPVYYSKGVFNSI
jgi:hypothetical protein